MAIRHLDEDDAIPTRRVQRVTTLDAAYVAHPDRFRKRPVPPRLPEVAWINQPQSA